MVAEGPIQLYSVVKEKSIIFVKIAIVVEMAVPKNKYNNWSLAIPTDLTNFEITL
ncbi:MAG: hypothetical protein WCX71_05945 [Candidatus Buchananbacteria bacterium]